MHGPLFTVFGYAVSGYPLFIALGFLLATSMGALCVQRIGQNPDVVVDLGLIALVSGLLGARLLHVLADGFFWDYVHLCTDPKQVDWRVLQGECGPLGGVWDASLGVCHPKARDCWAWAQFWGGGLTFYGGLIAATVASWLLFRRDRFPFWKGADMGGMMVPIGLGLGRLGCLMAGCCFGTVCHLPWALRFPARSPASEWQAREQLLGSPLEPSLAVHPTQLYEAFAALTLSAALIGFVHPRKRYDGQVFVAFLGLYGVARFCIELFRSDDRGGYLLSTSQWIALGLGATALYLHTRLSTRARRQAASAPATGQAASS